MSKFVQSLSNIAYTENNMVTKQSTLNPLLDLFYRIGNRVKRAWGNTFTPDVIVNLAIEALKHNYNLAIKIIGWSRAVRQGAGVRIHLRQIVMSGIIPDRDISWQWFSKMGYWKDIFYFDPDTLSALSLGSILQLIASSLEDNLLLKYLPRRKKNKQHKNNRWIYAITHYLGISEKEYRKICSRYQSPEALMCAGLWHKINYEQLPGKCMQKNEKSFLKHDEARYREYLAKLVKGEAKAKAGALYPHEIVAMLSRNASLAEGQWKALPDTFKSDRRIFVVADTSGSMEMFNEPKPITISKSLALFFSERLTGAFHNFCAIFSEKPVFLQFKDGQSLKDRFNKMSCINAGNTNIEALINMITHKIKVENIPEEDCPEAIMIISDMQFDQGVVCPEEGVQEMLKRKYAEINRTVPVIIYWNVANSNGVPVTGNEKNVVLFSGSSPNTMGAALGNTIDPYQSMLSTVDKEEYYFLLK